MSRPALFLGRSDNGQLYEADSGFTDGATVYTAKATTDPVAPQGVDREAVFPGVWLTLTHRLEPVVPDVDPTDTVVVSLTPIIDGVRGTTETFNVKMRPRDAVNPPMRVSRTYEIGLSQPIMRGLVEVGRAAYRGRFFQVEVSLPGTDISVEGTAVEWESVRETNTPV